jgi:hypothetical protein
MEIVRDNHTVDQKLRAHSQVTRGRRPLDLTQRGIRFAHQLTQIRVEWLSLNLLA